MVGIHWADGMGTGLPGWPGAVGSCLAIQAAILMMGSLLGLCQRFDTGERFAVTNQQPQPQRSLNLFRPVQANDGSRLEALNQDGSRTMATQLAPSITSR